MKEEHLKRIEKEKVIAIIREDSKEEAYHAAEACIKGGLGIVEITMNTPEAENIISELCKNFPEVLMGAGTVLNIDLANRAIKAGAKFIVSPHTDPEIIKYCNERNIIVCPGTTTPTEIFNADKYGADIIKVFPISNLGGPSYIKNVRGPLPHLRLMPTGGVKIEDINDYIAAGVFAVGISRSLMPQNIVKAGDFKIIESLTRELLGKIKN